MSEAKEITDEEKYSQVLTYLKYEESYPAFIEQKLGSQALVEFQEECQKGTEPVPEDANYGKKYEIAFSNWAWIGGTKFGFIRNRMGEEGINELIKFEVEVFKKSVPGPVKFLVKLMRAISPGSAFKMSAKQTAGMMRFMGPVSITEFSKKRMVVDIPHCKLVDYPGGEDSCLVGCQRVTSAFMVEQFGIDMKTKRDGSHCVITLNAL